MQGINWKKWNYRVKKINHNFTFFFSARKKELFQRTKSHRTCTCKQISARGSLVKEEIQLSLQITFVRLPRLPNFELQEECEIEGRRRFTKDQHNEIENKEAIISGPSSISDQPPVDATEKVHFPFLSNFRKSQEMK